MLCDSYDSYDHIVSKSNHCGISYGLRMVARMTPRPLSSSMVNPDNSTFMGAYSQLAYHAGVYGKITHRIIAKVGSIKLLDSYKIL